MGIEASAFTCFFTTLLCLLPLLMWIFTTVNVRFPVATLKVGNCYVYN